MKLTFLKVLSTTAVFLTAPAAFAFAPPSVESNNDGVKSYKAEQYPQAFKQFAGALAKDPYNPFFHFNLADSFYRSGEIPKALSEYEAVEQNPKAPNDLKFNAMFNAGNAAVEAKDIPKALAYYQKALEYNPDSIETKTNIELALKDDQGKGGDNKDQKDKQDQKKDDKNKSGDKKDDKQQQDGDKKDKDQGNQGQQQPTPAPRPTPQGFKSQALSEGDVRRILEELKRQEEEIRAKQYKENKDTPDHSPEKDW